MRITFHRHLVDLLNRRSGPAPARADQEEVAGLIRRLQVLESAPEPDLLRGRSRILKESVSRGSGRRRLGVAFAVVNRPLEIILVTIALVAVAEFLHASFTLPRSEDLENSVPPFLSTPTLAYLAPPAGQPSATIMNTGTPAISPPHFEIDSQITVVPRSDALATPSSDKTVGFWVGAVESPLSANESQRSADVSDCVVVGCANRDDIIETVATPTPLLSLTRSHQPLLGE